MGDGWRSASALLDRDEQETTNYMARIAGGGKLVDLCATPLCGKDAGHRGRHRNQGPAINRIPTPPKIEEPVSEPAPEAPELRLMDRPDASKKSLIVAGPWDLPGLRKLMSFVAPTVHVHYYADDDWFVITEEG